GSIQTPAIASDGTIYISDNYHYLYALSADGALKWKYNILDGSSPTIGSDGTIYVGSKYGLYALNPNGELVWQNQDLSNGDWVKAPVLDSDGIIYTVSQIGPGDNSRNVYALNPQDGSIIWKSASSTFDTAPALDDNGTIFVGGIYGLYALDPPNNEPKWSNLIQIGEISSSIAAVGQDVIYVGSHDYYLYALNKTDGNIKWTFNAQGKIHASPIIDKEGTIYIGSNSKTFYAVNPTDGSLKWQAELNGVISQGAAIDSTGTIYIASDDGTLYAFGE
ncbi:MAG: PQQ-binding-like beta-propeller repeat protein, partial [Candidatus Portnoybacteria bacterium]|nr:PQQ-binding-like beta-propeller repeat protein [Candidatus Portnoybacteria bacterium]